MKPPLDFLLALEPTEVERTRWVLFLTEDAFEGVGGTDAVRELPSSSASSSSSNKCGFSTSSVTSLIKASNSEALPRFFNFNFNLFVVVVALFGLISTTFSAVGTRTGAHGTTGASVSLFNISDIKGTSGFVIFLLGSRPCDLRVLIDFKPSAS